MKLSALISTLFLSVSLLSSSLQAAQSLRFGYETSQSDSQHQAAEKFRSLLEARTQGELSLRLFPDSTLGNAQAMISGVRSGSIDMEMSGSNNFTGLLPALNVLDIPFLFRNTEHAYRVLDGEIGAALLSRLETVGLKGLAYWENGWRDVTNSRRPVQTPADLKGLKIRTNNSPMNIAAFRLLGANPLPMPFSEVYTALETRAIDAQEHPINVTYSAKFYEVQKYLTLTHHAYSPLIVVMNLKRFQALEPAYQQALLSAAREAGEYQRQRVAEDQQRVIAAMRASGVAVIEQPDRQTFAEALGGQVRDMFLQAQPQEAALLRAIGQTQ